jgi:hypothetical protein
MSEVKAFSIAGLKLWFPSNDHEPPHFHAKRRGEWIFKVHFLQPPGEMLELVWTAKKKQMSKADRGMLESKVEKHRLDLLREWEQKANRL